MELHVAATPKAAARALAVRVEVAARRAMGQRGVFNLALSGGSSASAVMAALVDTEIFWGRVNVYQVDERVAPEGEPSRNATALVAELAEQVGLPPERLHLMDVTSGDLPAAAQRYAAALPNVLDVVQLGLGADGHTASWPPGDPVVTSPDKVAVVGPLNGQLRMTLTPLAVNTATLRLFYVVGSDKIEVLPRLRAGDPALAASAVSADRTMIHTDRATAGPLDGPPPDT
jgi:6-phosphogluconolactonase/glucosamine-6-phosphate isomerase/deaminase